MAGLIAGHIFRHNNPTIYEAQKSLPNNHAALLRFRTDEVSQATGIPFKKVLVQKGIFFNGKLHNHCTIEMANLYSQKTTSAVFSRSIWNLEPVNRYIAPTNFIELLAKGLRIEYEAPLKESDLLEREEAKEPIISTIPMPTLMEIADWPNKPQFFYKSICSIVADITDFNCDVYQTIYFPQENIPFYRASITGNHVIFESMAYIPQNQSVKVDIVMNLEKFFGIRLDGTHQLKNVKIKQQQYGKIINIDKKETQAFIMAMTDKHNIYSLGRFSTWRQLLLDDMIKDCFIINRLMLTKDTYEQKLNRGNSDGKC